MKPLPHDRALRRRRDSTPCLRQKRIDAATCTPPVHREIYGKVMEFMKTFQSPPPTNPPLCYVMRMRDECRQTGRQRLRSNSSATPLATTNVSIEKT